MSENAADIQTPDVPDSRRETREVQAGDSSPGGKGAACESSDSGGSPDVVSPESERENSLRQRIGELNDKYLRAVAELQNYQRRVAAEKNEALRYASSGLARSLLPVVDDLERTLQAVGDDEAETAVVKGVRLIRQNLLKALSDHHVERMESVGRPFDPASHEAHPPGTVVEEYEPGYKLWDRVLRPAKVIVSAASAQEGSTEAKDES